MINREWSLSGNEIANQFQFDDVALMNDFHAIACGMPEYGDDDRLEIGRATQYRTGNIAVLGPGSGLGMSAWIHGESNGLAMGGEGGHITLAGLDTAEDTIIARIRDHYGHCSAERILSGPGLITLHRAMHDVAVASAEEITTNTDDPHCTATLKQFFRFLGSAATDLALITGACGLYLAGGIVPANIRFIENSDFRSRFEDKNRYADYMRAIPTWVITAHEPGLTGLAAFIRQASNSFLSGIGRPGQSGPGI